MTIKTTERSTQGREIDMARKDRSADPAEIQLAIEAAIQDFVGKGLVRKDGLNGLVDMKSFGNTRLPAKCS